MTETELFVWNLEEVRRRSIKVWKSIPADRLNWKPDPEAMSIAEMIRHVLEGEHYYHLAIINRGSLVSYDSPFENRDFVSVEDELTFAQPYRDEFIRIVKCLTPEELGTVQIDRRDVGYIRALPDMLLRIAYHEAVHTGQLLDYMRTAQIDRPKVWD